MTLPEQIEHLKKECKSLEKEIRIQSEQKLELLLSINKTKQEITQLYEKSLLKIKQLEQEKEIYKSMFFSVLENQILEDIKEEYDLYYLEGE